MAKLTILEEIQSAIRTAALEAGPKETSRAVASKVFDDYRELIRQFEQQWIVEKLATVIVRLSGKSGSPSACDRSERRGRNYRSSSGKVK